MTSSTGPCDPGALDDLACQAKGIAAQAKYNEDHDEDLSRARADFGAARSAYSTARHDADKTLIAGRDQLHRIFADRCSIDQQQRERLDRAFHQVRARLEKCRPEPCCSDGDCEWDDEVRDCEEPDDLKALVARISSHVDEAESCFEDLLEETKPAPVSKPSGADTPAPRDGAAGGVGDAGTESPSGLAARVQRLLAEIAHVEEQAERGQWPASRVYAAALVARWHLEGVWNGFADVNDYVDCLCRALTCMIKGHAAIATLRRKEAVEDCRRQTWENACRALDENAVDEVLAVYLRICDDDDDVDSDSAQGYGGPGTGAEEQGGGPVDGGAPAYGSGGQDESRGPSDGAAAADRASSTSDSAGYAATPSETTYQRGQQAAAGPEDDPGDEPQPAPQESGRRPRYRDSRGRYTAP